MASESKTTMETRIDSFISEHSLGESIKDELCALISGCFDDMFKHLMNVPVPETTAVKKSKPVAKVVIEDVSSVESMDQLSNCTTASLSQYCKDNELKVGGNKREVAERIWRHLQGNGSDEDKGRTAKPKKAKLPVEKHECCGRNAAGAPCAIGGQEQYEEHWFCWRHINHAAEIVEKITPVPVVQKEVIKKTKKKVLEPEPILEPEPVSEPEPILEPEVKKVVVKKKIVKKSELVSE